MEPSFLLRLIFISVIFTQINVSISIDKRPPFSKFIQMSLKNFLKMLEDLKRKFFKSLSDFGATTTTADSETTMTTAPEANTHASAAVARIMAEVSSEAPKDERLDKFIHGLNDLLNTKSTKNPSCGLTLGDRFFQKMNDMLNKVGDSDPKNVLNNMDPSTLFCLKGILKKVHDEGITQSNYRQKFANTDLTTKLCLRRVVRKLNDMTSSKLGKNLEPHLASTSETSASSPSLGFKDMTSSKLGKNPEPHLASTSETSASSPSLGFKGQESYANPLQRSDDPSISMTSSNLGKNLEPHLASTSETSASSLSLGFKGQESSANPLQRSDDPSIRSRDSGYSPRSTQPRYNQLDQLDHNVFIGRSTIDDNPSEKVHTKEETSCPDH